MINVITGFDGSCPRSEQAVKKINDNSFIILPSYGKEEGTTYEQKGAGLRFCVKIQNNSQQKKWVELKLNWEGPPKKKGASGSNKFRDYFYIKNEPDHDYKLIPSRIEEPFVVLRLVLNSGTHILCDDPLYNYTQYENFVNSLKNHDFVNIEKAGESEEDRNIWRVQITNTSPGEIKKNALIFARSHAWEVCGSFLIEGMVKWLLSDDHTATYFMDKFVFNFVPMINPDGVHNGLSHLTRLVNGIHVEDVEIPFEDKSHATFAKLVNDIKPDLYLSPHQWRTKHQDGLYTDDKNFANGIIKYMPDQIQFGKTWLVKIFDNSEEGKLILRKEGRLGHFTEVEKEYKPVWRSYCNKNFNAMAANFEFPFFGRTVKNMREAGENLLKACLRAYIELNNI